MEFYIRRQTVSFYIIHSIRDVAANDEQMKAILGLSPTASLREIVGHSTFFLMMI